MRLPQLNAQLAERFGYSKTNKGLVFYHKYPGNPRSRCNLDSRLWHSFAP
jgi:hypothetical protein